MNEDRVQLVVGSGPTKSLGKRLSTWTEYEFTEDMMQAANEFSVKLSLSGAGNDVPPEQYIEQVCMLTLPDSVVTLELDGILLGTGIIVDQFIGDGDDGEPFIEVSGMDPAMVLLANEVDPKMHVSTTTTLPQLAELILQPYRGRGISFNIVADDIANRNLLTGKMISAGKTIKTSRGAAAVIRPGTNNFFVNQTLEDVQPHPAETEWDFLYRHAQNIGVIPYFTAAGDLTFITPDYAQDELFRFNRYRNQTDKTNVLSGGVRRSMASAATSVEVLGRGSLYISKDPRPSGRKTMVHRATKKKPPIRGVSTTKLPHIWPRRRWLRDTNPSNDGEAVRLANRELAHRNANTIAYEYKMAGHRDNRNYAYTVNTMAHIHDDLPRPLHDLSALITRRVVRKSRAATNATTTQVALVPRGAIVL